MTLAGTGACIQRPVVLEMPRETKATVNTIDPQGSMPGDARQDDGWPRLACEMRGYSVEPTLPGDGRGLKHDRCSESLEEADQVSLSGRFGPQLTPASDSG